MKTLVHLAIVAAVVVAAPAFSQAGADNSGGGNISASQLATAAQISEILRTAKGDLWPYFSAESVAINTAATDGSVVKGTVYEKLYLGQLTVLHALARTAINAKLDGPCQDPSTGVATDGSAVGPLPGRICISVFNLAQKVEPSSARVKTLALVAHEVSHLLGANEAEAEQFQNDIEVRIGEHGPNDTHQLFVDTWLGMHGSTVALGAMIQNFDKYSDKDVASAVSDALSGLASLRPSLSAIAIFPWAQDRYVRAANAKLTVLADRLTLVTSAPAQIMKQAREDLDRMFLQDDTITFETWEERTLGKSYGPLGRQLFLHKQGNRAEILDELKEVQEMLVYLDGFDDQLSDVFAD